METPAAFSLPKGLKLSIYEGDKLPDLEVYKRIIGKLLYLNMTRPDISYVIQQLSDQFLSYPRMPHVLAVQHVLKYLKGTLQHGLFYYAQNYHQLVAYCDADWTSCYYSGRSLIGYCVFFGSSLIF